MNNNQNYSDILEFIKKKFNELSIEFYEKDGILEDNYQQEMKRYYLDERKNQKTNLEEYFSPYANKNNKLDLVSITEIINSKSRSNKSINEYTNWRCDLTSEHNNDSKIETFFEFHEYKFDKNKENKVYYTFINSKNGIEWQNVFDFFKSIWYPILYLDNNNKHIPFSIMINFNKYKKTFKNKELFIEYKGNNIKLISENNTSEFEAFNNFERNGSKDIKDFLIELFKKINKEYNSFSFIVKR